LRSIGHSTGRVIGLGVVSSAAFLFATSALAQQRPVAAAVNLDEIVVTARKRAESVQDIPAAITAVDSQTLSDRSIHDLRGISQLVPSLEYSQHNTATFVMLRGVGASVTNGIAEPSVVTYVDGVLLPRSSMGWLQQSDLERVEVLRGPQGTLYGRNASGGAINLISKKPTDEPTAGVRIGVGDRNLRTFGGFISGPVVDGVSARLSATSTRDDGYYKNIYTRRSELNVDLINVRAAVRAELTPGFTINMSAQYQENKGSIAPQQIFRLTNPAIYPAGTIITEKPWEIAGEGPSYTLNKTWLYAATAEWKMSDSLTIRSVTGNVLHNAVFGFDADATSFGRFNIPIFAKPSRSVSQEFDLLGDNGPFQWVAGAYYYKEHFGVTRVDSFPSGLGATLPGGTSLTLLDQHTKSYAAFIDGTYSFTEALRLNVGLRYNKEDLTFHHTVGGRPPGTPTNAPIVVGVNFTGIQNQPGQIKSRKWLPKVGLQYDIAPQTMTYASYSKGFKSGGPNSGLPALNYLPEELDAYEVGLKTTALDGKLTVNAAAYYYDYSNLQVNIVLPVGVASAIRNADARIKGVEVEAVYRPIEPLAINVGAAITHAKYTKFDSIDPFQPQLGLQNEKGGQLAIVPTHTLSVGASWTVPLELGPFSSAVLRGEVKHTGETFLQPQNRAIYRQAPYEMYNAFATLKNEEDNLSLSFYITNIANKAIKQNAGYSSALGFIYGEYAPPRRYGVTISRDF